MKRLLLWIIPLLLLCSFACAQEAEEITQECKIRACEDEIQLDRLMDKNYKTAWYTYTTGEHWLEVTAPEGKTIGSVYFQWKRNKDFVDYPYYPFQVEVYSQGEWVVYHVEKDNTFMANYLELPNVTAFRVRDVDGRFNRLRLCELSVFGVGEKPDWVQVWEPAPERAELMVVAAHPDDEMLYMGGTIPYYAGELDKETVVVMLTCGGFYRHLELLDALWLCGVRTYPVMVDMPDKVTSTTTQMYKYWSRNELYGAIVKAYRQFKPLVVVTHDVNGEYGHGAHKAAADAVRAASILAADPSEYEDSYEAYGVWDVPKIYLHLYHQGKIRMDWNQPLAFFDGKTALEMAEAGFQCHVSQRDKKYLEVLDSGPYDNAEFGLYRSLVGEDVAKNDFFENLENWVDPQ